MVVLRGQAAKAIFSGAFLIMLLLPVLQMLTGALPLPPPVQENRRLAQPPSLHALASPERFARQAQAWFDDHYGLRSLLVRAKTQFDYSVFGVSDRLHVGRHGWLFYRSVIDDEEPAVEVLSDAQLDRAMANLARLRDILAARGARLIVMTNQMADKFYPDELPATARRALGRHRFDDFRKRLHTLTGITYFDTTDWLTAWQRQGPIFHKTDFHWTDPTAARFAAMIVDTVARDEGRPLPFWRDHTVTVVRPFHGGEAMFMPLLFQSEEVGPWLVRTAPYPGEFGPADPPFESVWRARPGTPGLLAPMVLVGDSFADGLDRAGLYDFFQRSFRSRLKGATLPSVLTAMPADTRTFILQFNELRLPDIVALRLPG